MHPLKKRIKLSGDIISKEFWAQIDVSSDKKTRKKLFLNALEYGIVNILISPEDSDFESLGKASILYNNENEISNTTFLLKFKDSQELYEKLPTKKYDILILDPSDWKIIPLENIIAIFQKTDTKIFVCASEVEEANMFLQILETGVDGIVIKMNEHTDLKSFQTLVSKPDDIVLTTVKIKNIKNIGMGDRVCIDTISLMVQGEGMLIGSQSSCLFLVQSESEYNGYVDPRPFRVNAGAVHAYAMDSENSMRYLSELKSGDSVLIVDSNGHTRKSTIGRCKIEKRPMILIEGTDGTNTYTTILQNAETVKLIGPEGSKSVSKIKKGDDVYVKLCCSGRHFGTAIDENIKEF